MATVGDSPPHHISTPPAVKHAKGSVPEDSPDEAPDDEHSRMGIPGRARECPDGMARSARRLLDCGDEAALLAAPDDEGQHTAPPQSRWISNSPGSMMQTCRGDDGTDPTFHCSRRVAPDIGASLAACRTSGGGGPKADAPRPHCRTLKYFPPPVDNKDQVSVDVIEHGSEVLVIRREPSPPPRIMALSTNPHSPFQQQQQQQQQRQHQLQLRNGPH